MPELGGGDDGKNGLAGNGVCGSGGGENAGGTRLEASGTVCVTRKSAGAGTGTAGAFRCTASIARVGVSRSPDVSICGRSRGAGTGGTSGRGGTTMPT